MPELLYAGTQTARDAAEQRVSLSTILKHYVVSAVLYGALLAVLALNPWYKQLLSVSAGVSVSQPTLAMLQARMLHPDRPPPGEITALQFYELLYVIYLAAALPGYLLTRPRSLRNSKNLLIWGAATRVARTALTLFSNAAKPAFAFSNDEKRALMFLLVKMIFGPLMLNSAFLEIKASTQLLSRGHGLSGWVAMDFAYILFVHLIFLVDSCLFFIGYHTESRLLKNELKAVDTNLWRVLVCIACYAPFNMVTISVLGSSLQDPYILIGGDFRGTATWLVRAGAVLFLCLLISSSLSLFTRASNLTNRGIVTWGPYRFVRHPGYFAKNMFWLMTLIPSLVPVPSSPSFSWSGYLITCLCTVTGFIGWATIYFMRSITEEQFLNQDPEYVAYCRRVKYRFIPGLY